MYFQYNYTQLNVENFQACKSFYRDVLQLDIRFEDDLDEYVEFDAGSSCLVLFSRKRITYFIPKYEQSNHDSKNTRVTLSFHVRNVEEALKYLQIHGVKVLNSSTIYPDRGLISACFQDPDGNLIELEQVTDILIS